MGKGGSKTPSKTDGESDTGSGKASATSPGNDRYRSMEDPTDTLARQAIIAFLDGHSAEVATAECGPWGEIVTALQDAHRANGVDGVRKTFATLARANYDLIRLVASRPVSTKTRWTASELLETEFPDPQWAIPGVVPVGLTFLAGRPKLGKSWLALQFALAVGTGGRTFDQQIEQGKVLFLALEDSPRRLKERIQKQGVPPNDQITFATEWLALDEGGLTELQAEVGRYHPRLVIVDTFSRLAGHIDQQDVGAMTIALVNLQRLAHTHNLCLMLIDHHRKGSGFSQNPVDDILGSTAKSGVADAALGLFREQGKRTANLKIIGREVEEHELALDFDTLTCSWQLLGEAGDVLRDTVKADIVGAIRTLTEADEIATTTAIAGFLGKERSNISQSLAELATQGKVVKGKKRGREQPYLLSSDLPQKDVALQEQSGTA